MILVGVGKSNLNNLKSDETSFMNVPKEYEPRNEEMYIGIVFLKGERKRDIYIWKKEDIRSKIELLQGDNSKVIRELIKLDRYNSDSELRRYGLFESQEPYLDEEDFMKMKFRYKKSVCMNRSLNKVKISGRKYIILLKTEIKVNGILTSIMVMDKEEMIEFATKNIGFIDIIYAIDEMGNIAPVEYKLMGFEFKIVDSQKSRDILKFYRGLEKERMREERKRLKEKRKRR